MNPQKFHLIDETRLRNCIEYASNLPLGKNWVVTFTKESRPRTTTQNAALHKYFELLADKFNDGGLDQKKVLAKIREGVDIPWSKDSIKESLWHPMQQAIIGQESTTKLTTEQVSQVYDILNRWTAQAFGVSVDFPEKEVGK